MTSYETMENREQTLMRLINESRYELQFQALAPRDLEATMKAWLRRLYSIPDEKLQRCFDIALERHAKRSALIPAQIIEAWAIVREEMETAARYSERESCQFNCSAEGWITVNADGSIWTGQEGRTFAKPCPTHRPRGWRVGEMTDKNFKGFQQKMNQ
jgi:hypothetical protein